MNIMHWTNLPHLKAHCGSSANFTTLGFSFFILKNGSESSFPHKTLVGRKQVIQKSRNFSLSIMNSNLHTEINNNANSNTNSY